MRGLNRLHELALDLPEPAPRHEFLPVTLARDLAFVSGHAPYRDGSVRFTGKVGSELDLPTAQKAAQLALLGCLRAIQDSFGTLDAVRQVLKLTGYVNCASDFHNLPRVTDAASSILVALFGDPGRHARTTIGVNSLQNDAAVEVGLIVEVSREMKESGESTLNNLGAKP